MSKISPYHKETLKLDKEVLASKSSFDYIISKDLKFHLSLSEDIYNTPTGIFLDSFEISKDFSKPTNGYVDYNTNFNIKPGKHSLVINKQKIEVNAIYMFDLDQHFDDIKNTWQSRSDNFAKVTKDGILLKNVDRQYGSFAFKRFYSDKLYVNFDFVPLQFKPGMVIYFGDNIYFMINHNNIMVMKKGLNKQRDTKVDKKSIPLIQNNKLQKIEIERNLDTYTINLNNEKVLDYNDSKELRNQRFRNIGISMPNNGCEILLKKIIIK
ncbi:MAG: hypothetical protein PHT07_10790 [Paludibacter sp.]|nr:hypothetical protein [Paludibacter sp.]